MRAGPHGWHGDGWLGAGVLAHTAAGADGADDCDRTNVRYTIADYRYYLQLAATPYG